MLQQRAEGVEYGGPSELTHKDPEGCDTRNRRLSRMVKELKTFWECILGLKTERRVAKALCSRLSPKKGGRGMSSSTILSLSNTGVSNLWGYQSLSIRTVFHQHNAKCNIKCKGINFE